MFTYFSDEETETQEDKSICMNHPVRVYTPCDAVSFSHTLSFNSSLATFPALTSSSDTCAQVSYALEGQVRKTWSFQVTVHFIIPSNMGYLCTYLLAFCPCLLSWVLPNCTRTWAQETGSLRGPAVQGPHQNHRGFSEVRLQVSEGNLRSDTNQCGPPGSSSSMDV